MTVHVKNVNARAWIIELIERFATEVNCFGLCNRCSEYELLWQRRTHTIDGITRKGNGNDRVMKRKRRQFFCSCTWSSRRTGWWWRFEINFSTSNEHGSWVECRFLPAKTYVAAENFRRAICIAPCNGNHLVAEWNFQRFGLHGKLKQVTVTYRPNAALCRSTKRAPIDSHKAYRKSADFCLLQFQLFDARQRAIVFHCRTLASISNIWLLFECR